MSQSFLLCGFSSCYAWQQKARCSISAVMYFRDYLPFFTHSSTEGHEKSFVNFREFLVYDQIDHTEIMAQLLLNSILKLNCKLICCFLCSFSKKKGHLAGGCKGTMSLLHNISCWHEETGNNSWQIRFFIGRLRVQFIKMISYTLNPLEMEN